MYVYIIVFYNLGFENRAMEIGNNFVMIKAVNDVKVTWTF